VPETGQHIDVFGQGGGQRTAEAMDIPFLGALPLDPRVRVAGDTGEPVTLLGEDNPQAAGFYAIARRLVERCEEAGSRPAPTFTVEE
jgi:ATP-binding protein involved in chromosome partitioning